MEAPVEAPQETRQGIWSVYSWGRTRGWAFAPAVLEAFSKAHNSASVPQAWHFLSFSQLGSVCGPQRSFILNRGTSLHGCFCSHCCFFPTWGAGVASAFLHFYGPFGVRGTVASTGPRPGLAVSNLEILPMGSASAWGNLSVPRPGKNKNSGVGAIGGHPHQLSGMDALFLGGLAPRTRWRRLPKKGALFVVRVWPKPGDQG